MPTQLEGGSGLLTGISGTGAPTQPAPNQPGGSDSGPQVQMSSPSSPAAPPPAARQVSPKLSGSYGDITVRTETGDAAAKRARQCPGRRILADEVVEIMAIPDNAGSVSYSNSSANAAVYGPNAIAAINQNPRTIHVSNLAEIWFYAANDKDGLAIRIYKVG